MAGMMHWQLQERSIWTCKFSHLRHVTPASSNVRIVHDDKKRISKTFGLIGSAFLALLNEIDMAGLLKPDTEIHDLGLVMCMALEWTDRREEHEIDRSDLEWRNTVVAYAAKAKIDLNDAPLRNARTLVAGIGKVTALVGNARSGRWKWVRKVGPDCFTRGYQQQTNESKLTIPPSFANSRMSTVTSVAIPTTSSER